MRACFACVAVLLAGAGLAHGAPAILPLSAVKPGMVGQALTVFSGTKPEPFQVRVVSVVHNFNPHHDVILIKAEDPRVAFSGIVAGMSGSPVYVEGKLMGAIAYGWSFQKEPLAGVQPIESMLAEQSRPRRQSNNELALTPPTQDRAAFGESRLVPVSVPLAVSGLSQAALDDLTEEMRPYGMAPMRAGAGGGGTAGRAPGPVVPGGVIGVQLIRGDMNAAGIGTVTYVDGNTVLAFGHPLFGMGEVALPMVTGEVHAFVNSLASSFKLASPIGDVGTVVQDRQTCIVGKMGPTVGMMPVRVTVTGPGAGPRVFNAEVARNRRLSALLASLVINSAIADAEPDITEMAISLSSRLDVSGLGPIELKDEIFSPEGISPHALGLSRGLRALAEIPANPFSPAFINRLDVSVSVQFRKDLAEIVSVALPGGQVHAGDTVPLRVTLRPYAGDEYVETLPVKIPLSLAGTHVHAEIASGALVHPDVPRPENLRGFVANLSAYFNASSLVVSLATPDDGASVGGRLVPALPAVALDTLRTSNLSRHPEAYRIAARTVFASQRLVTGKVEISIDVHDDLLGKNF